MMIPQLHVSGSHFEVGLAIGQHFAHQIHEAFNTYPFFQHEIIAYHQTEAGQARFAHLLDLHQKHYPEYMQELKGIAEGASRPFEDIFLINLRGEYASFVQETDIRGCSDCSLFTENVALIGHNEDGTPSFREHMYIVQVAVDGKAPFTACSYPGFLCGNAFGFNTHGTCGSIDNIRPGNIRPGIGRHFCARSLLEADSIADAITRITPPNRASGFSYTIGSVAARRIVQVEVTPDNYHVHEIQGPNFHANHILEIQDAPQEIRISSKTRVSRALSLIEEKVPENADDILDILGDQSDEEFPIYRTATAPDDLETFCTALFDLDARQLHVYTRIAAESKVNCMTFEI